MPKVTLKLDYYFGQIVYLKTDNEQLARIVTRIELRPDGVTYCLACSNLESWHSSLEITRDRNVLQTLTN